MKAVGCMTLPSVKRDESNRDFSRAPGTPLRSSAGLSTAHNAGRRHMPQVLNWEPTNNAARMVNEKFQTCSRRGIVTFPDGKVTNIPEGMLTDQYGMAGVLASLRATETNPAIRALSVGIDLMPLVPQENPINEQNLLRFLRHWRFHKTLRLWFVYWGYGSFTEQSLKYEKGYYNVFDPIKWEEGTRFLTVKYNQIAGPPPVPLSEEDWDLFDSDSDGDAYGRGNNVSDHDNSGDVEDNGRYGDFDHDNDNNVTDNSDHYDDDDGGHDANYGGSRPGHGGNDAENDNDDDDNFGDLDHWENGSSFFSGTDEDIYNNGNDGDHHNDNGGNDGEGGDNHDNSGGDNDTYGNHDGGDDDTSGNHDQSDDGEDDDGDGACGNDGGGRDSDGGGNSDGDEDDGDDYDDDDTDFYLDLIDEDFVEFDEYLDEDDYLYLDDYIVLPEEVEFVLPPDEQLPADHPRRFMPRGCYPNAGG